jgi:orotate phosphoribosyltransferase
MANILNENVEDIRHTADGKFIQGASHTCRVINHKSRNKIIIKAICDLRKIKDSFDTIACCGISGLMVVPQIAEILEKNILVVRKDERRYSEFLMEGAAPYRYVIVDDLVCSGRTVLYIKNAIYEDNPRAKCVGVYCYIPDECAYVGDEGIKLFHRDFGTTLLNPYHKTT